MSFLAPLFALGAAAVVLPIVFHMIRRSPRAKKVFSTLMFLDPSTPRLTRRSRLEHLLLLLLRCLVICLLALAFARPFWNEPMPEAPSEGLAKKTVVLLDVSASMKREDLWPAAVERVDSLVNQSSTVDQLAVYAFDEQLRPLVTFAEWNAMTAADRAGQVRGRLGGIEPGWGSTLLDQSLIQAAETLVEGDEGQPALVRQVVLVTDLQEGSRTSDLQAYEWPEGVTVRTERLLPKHSGNASVQWLAGDAHSGDLSVRLRISNTQESSQDQFQLGWAQKAGGFVGAPQEVYVAAGQSRVATLPPPIAGNDGREVLLRGDDEPFDNRVFLIPPAQARFNVLYLGEDSERDSSQPLYFLRRAFTDTARQAIHVAAVPPGQPLDRKLFSESALIIATDPLNESDIREARAGIQQGAILLFVPKDVAGAPTLAQLIGIPEVPMTEYVPRDYSMLGQVDFRHPLFAPFADERFSDFTGIHFWKHRRIDESILPDARVLARFDNDDPALLEIPVGQGRLLVLTSGWHPADSQLALSSKFVPLLYSLLELGGRATQPPPQCFVGDGLPLTSDATNVTVEGLGGVAETWNVGGKPLLRAQVPGVYTVSSPRSTGRIAVNLDPLESRTAPLPLDELERLGVPSPNATQDPVRTARRTVQLHRAEMEARQKLWRWAIVFTLVVLLAETWLGGWTDRRTVSERAST